MENAKQYVLGITLYRKEDYDRLMNEHSTETQRFFSMGLDFKGLFKGYPPDYPCLVEYYLGKDNPINDLRFSKLLPELIDDGFAIRLYKEGAYRPLLD